MPEKFNWKNPVVSPGSHSTRKDEGKYLGSHCITEHSTLQGTSMASSTLSETCFLSIHRWRIRKTGLGGLIETVLQDEWRVALGRSGTRAQGSQYVSVLSGLILGYLNNGCTGSYVMFSLDKMASCACCRIYIGGSGEIKNPSWIKTLESMAIRDCSMSKSFRRTVLYVFKIRYA